jgi:hypothetical protein
MLRRFRFLLLIVCVLFVNGALKAEKIEYQPLSISKLLNWTSSKDQSSVGEKETRGEYLPVPEPATYFLLGALIAFTMAFRRRSPAGKSFQ